MIRVIEAGYTLEGFVPLEAIHAAPIENTPEALVDLLSALADD